VAEDAKGDLVTFEHSQKLIYLIERIVQRVELLTPDPLCVAMNGFRHERLAAPRLSMIVSSFDRPEHLKLVLQSLKLQSSAEQIEVIVTDNSPTEINRGVVASMRTPFDLHYFPTKATCCYSAAELAAAKARGDFLGFPSDDDWFASEYCERMLKAADANSWDMVFCDCLYDPWTAITANPPLEAGRYRILEANPVLGQVDKAGFIVRRSLFLEMEGFPQKVPGGSSGSDSAFVQAAAARCAWGKVPEVMWSHG
jgi:hypothetical protein